MAKSDTRTLFFIMTFDFKKNEVCPQHEPRTVKQSGTDLVSNTIFAEFFFSKVELVSRLPPLRYRFGLSDPPKAVAPRSVRCLNHTLQSIFQTGELILSNSPRQNTTKNKLVRIEISRSVPVLGCKEAKQREVCPCFTKQGLSLSRALSWNINIHLVCTSLEFF